MKALVYTGEKPLEYRDAPDPVTTGDDVLIRVESVGICGSDMHAFLGHDERRPAPLILGHEAAGVIVDGARDGERVTVNPLVTCGTCEACTSGRDNLCASRQIISMPPREGAFAQYITMPQSNLVTIPDAIGFSQAALAEPIACGWHTVRMGLAMISQSPANLSCLVLGGGAIGLGAALSLRAQGVEDITLVEPNDKRRQFLSERCNQAVVANADSLDASSFDFIVDGVGYAATRAAACALAKPGGVIGHIGLGQATEGLDIRRMTLQEITFFGTYTYTAEDFRQTAAAIFDGRLGALDWIAERPLSKGQKAFEDILKGVVANPKIILKPQTGGE